MAVQTLTEFAEQVDGDQALQDQLKNDPVKAVKAEAEKAAAAYESDKTFYRIAIGGWLA